ncbi:hypothetical protein E2C01_087214 [Portunus trituberculatus]|uniref:Uncharacterized protein n=1 Tax=Portunus trituberculatus TaxID=210409 RepID=A0A5B7J7J5_PORTR|nr:hypothetical protein [Portunus trituberculatus]
MAASRPEVMVCCSPAGDLPLPLVPAGHGSLLPLRDQYFTRVTLAEPNLCVASECQETHTIPPLNPSNTPLAPAAPLARGTSLPVPARQLPPPSQPRTHLGGHTLRGR